MTNISKLDYLQRYMSQDDKKGKKGSKKKKKIKNHMVVVSRLLTMISQ